MVIWLIGLSGAGKTTIGQRLYTLIKARHANTVYLDGDILRDVWGDRLGHTVEARCLNAHRISHLCKMLDDQGIHVVASVLSLFPEWQAWNRQTFTRYFEVFIDVPLDVLRTRDPRGLYRDRDAGQIGDVVGIDIPFPVPANADMTVNNSCHRPDPEAIADQILEAIGPL